MPARYRWLLMFGTALLAPCAAAAQHAVPTRATVAAVDPAVVGDRGADVPFVEHEAENGRTNGIVIGPDRRFTTLAAEASGRRAVRLEGEGSFVEFMLGRDASALTLRYAIPDSADGTGIDASLGVYLGTERIGSLALTSRYGWFYGSYPFSNQPADGRAHHFYDHARLMLDRVLPAGSTIRLMIAAEDRVPWVAIDLIDLELPDPPGRRPAGSLSLVDFGADPTGRRQSGAALRNAVATARAVQRPLWIPPGEYRVDGHVIVDRVTIEGAGMWHSVLRGTGLGLYGHEAPNASQAVELRDFAVIGEVTERIDRLPLSGIGGAIGGGSRIERLWLQHHKVGLWFDGPMDGIVVSGLRIFDMTADGLNFHRGVRNAVLENSFVRGTGDDALAAWSGDAENVGIIFRNNTVVAPVLANGIAIYGGRNIDVSGNVVADTLIQGGGIHFGNRFNAVPLSGRVTVHDNILLRAGSFDPNWHYGVGALWFYALDAPIRAAIEITDLEVVDSSEEAILFTGSAVDGVALKDVRIVDPGSHAIAIRSAGSATMSEVRGQGIDRPAVLRCHAGFALRDGGGNVGMSSSASGPCGPMPRD